MWLHVPRCYLSALESAESTSGLWPADFAPWVTSSGTATQRLSSWHGWKKRNWITRLSGVTYPRSMLERGADAWISSLLDTRVSRSALPGSVKEPTTSGTCGRTSSESPSTAELPQSSARTSQDTFRLGSPTSSPTLPRAGSMRNGACSERPTWVRRTAASGCSSWPTAKAQTGDYQYSSGDHSKPVLNLEGAAKAWPTTTARDWKGAFSTGTGTDLAKSADSWATPDASVSTGYNQSDSPNAAKRPSLGLQAQQTMTGGRDTSQPAVLNPSFVEALMGFPIGWTVCVVSETP